MCAELDTMLSQLRLLVTSADIRAYSPRDPGYAGYVNDWAEILETGVVPDSMHFNVREVIGLTCWANAEDFDQPARFCHYRLFVNTVALKFLTTGSYTDEVLALNYLSIRLVDDVERIENGGAIQMAFGDLLSTVAGWLHENNPDHEIPFLYAAELIWAQRRSDFARAERAAQSLLDDIESVQGYEWTYWEDPDFLFGLTNFDQLNQQWLAAFSELQNPLNLKATRQVIAAMNSET